MTAPRSSTPRSDLERIAWPELEPEMVEQLRQAGTEREVEEGEVLFEVGQDSYDLLYIESGSISIVDRTDDEVVVEIRAPHSAHSGDRGHGDRRTGGHLVAD